MRPSPPTTRAVCAAPGRCRIAAREVDAALRPFARVARGGTQPWRQLGFIGTGTMGNPIAARLLAAGHELVVFDASPRGRGQPRSSAARGSPRRRARWREQCAVVFTSLPGPAEVRAVAEGADGLLAARRAGLVHVDLSTSSYDAVQTLGAAEASAGATLIDAPVSGGAFGAAQGTLAVMASGDRAAYDAVRPLFDAFAANVFYWARRVAARSRSSSTT